MMREVKEYIPAGVCARKIEFSLDNGIIERVVFTGGCAGNSQGVAMLVRGMKAEEVIRRLRGIDCKGKGTSCPDQLSRALEGVIGTE